MKRAAVALRTVLVNDVGLEGFFVLTGTIMLAIAAGRFDPAGPYVVVGLVALLAGIALARPPRAG